MSIAGATEKNGTANLLDFIAMTALTALKNQPRAARRSDMDQLKHPTVRCHFSQNGDDGIFTVTPIINGREVSGLFCGDNRELADWLTEKGYLEQSLKNAYRLGHQQAIFDIRNHIKGLLGL